MLDKLVNLFTSLRLTVVCLCLAVVLVFIGTLAQEPLGLYVAQERFFQSLFVDAACFGAGLHKFADMMMQAFGRPLPPINAQEVLSRPRIPIFPGGYLLGGILLVNLIAAHIKRFSISRKKIGIFMIHAGVILLLLGQFFTELFQVESNLRLEEGETKNYSDSSSKYELAVIDVTQPGHDQVVAIPEKHLRQGEVRDPHLPFTLRVKSYFPNSEPTLRGPAGEAAEATQGIGTRLFLAERPVTFAMNDRNVPSAYLEVLDDSGSLGTWMVSSWMTIPSLANEIRRQFGSRIGMNFDAPQEFTHGGRTYQLALRPVRYYHPHYIKLIKFSHDRYTGTEVPRNFSSRVHLTHPDTGEDRDILIRMNEPLRYGGATYYQASFEPGDTVSILHVVRNPAWLTPYIACSLVGLGLCWQFTAHLVGFANRRRRMG